MIMMHHQHPVPSLTDIHLDTVTHLLHVRECLDCVLDRVPGSSAVGYPQNFARA